MKNEVIKTISKSILAPIILGALGTLWGLTTDVFNGKIDARVFRQTHTLKKEIEKREIVSDKRLDRIEQKVDKLLFHLIPTK